MAINTPIGTENYFHILNGRESVVSIVEATQAKAWEMTKEVMDTFVSGDDAAREAFFNAARMGTSDPERKKDFTDKVMELADLWDTKNKAWVKTKDDKSTLVEATLRVIWEDPSEPVYTRLSIKRLKSMFTSLDLPITDPATGAPADKTTLEREWAKFQKDAKGYLQSFNGADLKTKEVSATSKTAFSVTDWRNNTCRWEPLGNYEDLDAAADHDLLNFMPNGFMAHAAHRPDVRHVGFGINNLIHLITEIRTPIRLVGPPGCGKTMACRWVAHKLKMPCELVPCSEALTEEQLFGMFKPEEGQKIVWIDGQLPKIVRQDVGMIIFDEWDHLPPDIASKLHQLLAERRITLQTGEVIRLHDGIRMVFTSNTTGHGNLNRRHGAARIADHAFLSRLPITLRVDYMPEKAEVSLLQNRWGVKAEDATRWIKVCSDSRKAIAEADRDSSKDSADQVLSIRETTAFGELIKAGLDAKTAFGLILNGFSDGDRLVYGQLAEKVFGWTA